MVPILLADAEDGDNVGVVQSRRGLGFALESLDLLGQDGPAGRATP